MTLGSVNNVCLCFVSSWAAIPQCSSTHRRQTDAGRVWLSRWIHLATRRMRRHVQAKTTGNISTVPALFPLFYLLLSISLVSAMTWHARCNCWLTFDCPNRSWKATCGFKRPSSLQFASWVNRYSLSLMVQWNNEYLKLFPFWFICTNLHLCSSVSMLFQTVISLSLPFVNHFWCGQFLFVNALQRSHTENYCCTNS